MFPVVTLYVQMQVANRWLPEHLLTVLTLMRADERGSSEAQRSELMV